MAQILRGDIYWAGKALTEAGDATQAMQTYRQGIEVAEKKGDKQAAKEMAVFLKRLEKGA